VRQKKIMAVLLGVLCLAICVLAANLLVLHRNIYRIPETAIEDLCRVLADEDIFLDKTMVPRNREDGMIYVSDGSDYESNTACLLAGSDIKNTFVIPGGQLFLHYNGDITEFSGGFGFRYRQASVTESGQSIPVDSSESAFETLTADLAPLPEDGTAAQAAMTFLDRQDEQLRQKLQIRTAIAAVRGEENGRAYVLCRRMIDGAEITENAVICMVENGTVMEAAGKWCFMRFGESYVTQLSDITNILFMMKRTLAGTDGCRVLGLERCYSLYFLAEDEGFCLIPCWRVETDTVGELVYSALDGTLYTKMEEIT